MAVASTSLKFARGPPLRPGRGQQRVRGGLELFEFVRTLVFDEILR